MFSRLRSLVRLASIQAARLLTLSGRQFTLIAFAIAVSVLAPAARADTITEYVGGVSTGGSAFFGQSVTTPGGGPWTNITFNFYDSSSNAYAIGNLYLLNTEYTGTPQNLSAATSGYIANVAASGTSWVFDPSVTLQPGAQYFVYMGGNTATDTNTLFGSGYAGGQEYSTGLATTNYSANAAFDMNFTLSGTQAAPAPIPGAGLLSYLLVGFGGAAAFRKRLRARAAALLAALKLRLRDVASLNPGALRLWPRMRAAAEVLRLV